MTGGALAGQAVDARSAALSAFGSRYYTLKRSKLLVDVQQGRDFVLQTIMTLYCEASISYYCFLRELRSMYFVGKVYESRLLWAEKEFCSLACLREIYETLVLVLLLPCLLQPFDDGLVASGHVGAGDAFRRRTVVHTCAGRDTKRVSVVR